MFSLARDVRQGISKSTVASDERRLRRKLIVMIEVFAAKRDPIHALPDQGDYKCSTSSKSTSKYSWRCETW